MRPNQRRCVSCRKIAPKADFWRIVRVFPSRTVQLEKGMGRSVYLCPQHSCLQLAQKKDRLGRSLKAAIPLEIYQTLWQHLSASDRMIGSTMVESTATDSAITESARAESSHQKAAKPESSQTSRTDKQDRRINDIETRNLKDVTLREVE